MGSYYSHGMRTTLCPEVFHGIAPIERGDPRRLPRRAHCPDCLRGFDGMTRPYHCRVCGETLCQRCSSPRRSWGGRPVCNHCVVILRTAYTQRIEKGEVIMEDDATKCAGGKHKRKGLRSLFVGIDIGEAMVRHS